MMGADKYRPEKRLNPKEIKSKVTSAEADVSRIVACSATLKRDEAGLGVLKKTTLRRMEYIIWEPPL